MEVVLEINSFMIIDKIKEKYLPIIGDVILENSEFFEKELSSSYNGKYYIFPCYSIELRNILSEGIIENNNPTFVFSYPFAIKYLNSMGIFLVFRSNDILPDTKPKQVHSINEDIVLEDNLQYFIMNEPIDKDIYEIIKSLMPEVDIHNLNYIPGLDARLIASNEQGGRNLNWYAKKLSQCIEPSITERDDIMVMDRQVSLPFKPGDRVRLRRRGMLMKQRKGSVAKIKNKKMLVEWDDGKKDIFDLSRPEIFETVLEKI